MGNEDDKKSNEDIATEENAEDGVEKMIDEKVNAHHEILSKELEGKIAAKVAEELEKMNVNDLAEKLYEKVDDDFKALSEDLKKTSKGKSKDKEEVDLSSIEADIKLIKAAIRVLASTTKSPEEYRIFGNMFPELVE